MIKYVSFKPALEKAGPIPNSSKAFTMSSEEKTVKPFSPQISVTLNYRHVVFGARLSRCHKVKEALCSSRYEKVNLAF